MQKKESIEKQYKLEEVLGEYLLFLHIRGTFAVVRRAVKKMTGEEVAVKIFKRYYLYTQLGICSLKMMRSLYKMKSKSSAMFSSLNKG
jgi:hypothetical protein